MNREQFKEEAVKFFEGDSHQQYGPARTFTAAEKEAFFQHLVELWERASVDVSPIDLQSRASIAAMIRAAKVSDSMQDQMRVFVDYYQQEAGKR